jgi:tetratricopeptide (TPR) repeat protein
VTEDEQRLGARLLAFAGLWLLLCGLLLALSFVVLALVALAALLVVGVAIGGRLALRQLGFGERLSDALVAAGDSAERFWRRLRRLRIKGPMKRAGGSARGGAKRIGGSARGRAKRVGAGVGSRATRAPGQANVLFASLLQAYARAVYRASAVVRRRRASQLNERGAQLRRNGHAVHAAEQHRVALEIVRGLGDEQAEALTLNSLGLALAQVGAEAEALEHLEQARGVLQALGDQEHEGQVLANLGLVYRRQGESEQASVLFQEALDRLPPGSAAYRHVMEELLRAS